MERRSDGESFFHRLARVVSEGRVLQYIDYQTEIPRDMCDSPLFISLNDLDYCFLLAMLSFVNA